MADICLDELTMKQLDLMTFGQLDTLPLACSPEGPEAGEWDYYSSDALASGLGTGGGASS